MLGRRLTLLLLLTLPGVSVVWAEARFVLEIEPAARERNRPIQALVERHAQTPLQIGRLNHVFKTPTEARIRFADDADWSADADRRLVMEYEFIGWAGWLLSDQGSFRSRAELDAFLRVMAYAEARLLAFGLIDLWGLEVAEMARPQEAFTGLLAEYLTDTVAVLFAVETLLERAASAGSAYSAQRPWQAGMFSPRALEEVACWLYGGDPLAFRELERVPFLPPGKAAECESTYPQRLKPWRDLLRPFLKIRL